MYLCMHAPVLPPHALYRPRNQCRAPRYLSNNMLELPRVPSLTYPPFEFSDDSLNPVNYCVAVRNRKLIVKTSSLSTFAPRTPAGEARSALAAEQEIIIH